MYLSNRDLKWALDRGRLIVDPYPEKIGDTSIDLHLDSVDEAKIWDIEKYKKDRSVSGDPEAELRLGTFDYGNLGKKYLVSPPEDKDERVFLRYDEIVIKPGGFILWQTKETVGTVADKADLICFIDGKSSRSRTGLIVHLTAPTIHAGWAGQVTLEIANLGPFDFVLKEDDAIAQITVAQISSIPDKNMKIDKLISYGQSNVTGISGKNI